MTGLAVSPDGRRLFALATSYQCTGEGACGGRCDLVGLDTISGKALKAVRLGSGCDQVAVTPDGDHVLVLSVDESLATLNSTAVRVEKTTRTAGFIAGDGASGFRLAPGGRTLYVADQFKGIVVNPVSR